VNGYKTRADSERKLREALASSCASLGMLDDGPIVVAVEIEGDLSLLNIAECTGSIGNPHSAP